MTLPATPPDASSFATDLGGSVLRDVSRSFYLSLRLLPPQMRRSCGLGYLLARLSDTVADAPRATPEQRRDWLRGLRSAYLHNSPAPSLTPLLPLLDHQGERMLVTRAEDCLSAWRACLGPEREALREVLDAITRGQLLDLDYFGKADTTHPRRLPSADALFLYADEVAGSVGRFWTRTAQFADPAFSSQPLALMLAWGTRYGRALQWINIIRDLHEDLPRGRAYLPDGEPPSAWLERAEAGLRDGLRYTNALRGRRLQLATVLPALLGAATVRKLRESGDGFLRERIKVSRAEAGAIVRGALWRVLLKRPLTAYFESLLQPNGTNSGGTGAVKASGTPVTG